MTHTEDNRAACDGGQLGHPLIYLTLHPSEEVICPYCSRLFPPLTPSKPVSPVEIDKN